MSVTRSAGGPPPERLSEAPLQSKFRGAFLL